MSSSAPVPTANAQRATANGIAVLKPDHIGDMVLAVPAIRTLVDRAGPLTLFGAPGTRFVVDHYLDGVTFEPMRVRHLSRDGSGIDAEEIVENLHDFDLVVALREDHVINEVLRQRKSPMLTIESSSTLHETELHRRLVSRIVGPYSRTQAMFPSGTPTWPDEIGAVGLSFGAGFTANKLATATFVEVARQLQRRGVQVALIGGPGEITELNFAASQLSLGPSDVIVGGNDLRQFAEDLRRLDVVVGADSGSMHLIAMEKPVLGVFTSSPWRRFAPTGPHVRVLRADLPCSPCVQFSRDIYNACLARECAGMIGPEAILAALDLPDQADGIEHVGRGLDVVFAPYRQPFMAV